MTHTQGRVAVFVGAGAPFELRDVVLKDPRAHELIVEVEMCTICGSDLHTISGRRPASVPLVLGHEAIGRVRQIPEEGAGDLLGHPLRRGDRVTWSLCASCGQCFSCRSQLPQKCDRLFKYGHEPISADYPSTGGFATHCQLRAGTGVLRVSDGVPDRVACPANCATATVAAAMRSAGDVAGKTVLVLGAGLLGLTATAWLHSARAAEIIVLDPWAERARLAEKFGASRSSSTPDSIRRDVDQCSDGRGADVVFEFSGATQAVSDGLACLRVGGRAVLVGSVLPAGSIALDPESIVRRCLQIVGVHNYAAEDLIAALAFLEAAHDTYPFESLVSATFDLEQLDEAVRFAGAGQAVRVAIVPFGGGGD